MEKIVPPEQRRAAFEAVVIVAVVGLGIVDADACAVRTSEVHPDFKGSLQHFAEWHVEALSRFPGAGHDFAHARNDRVIPGRELLLEPVREQFEVQLLVDDAQHLPAQFVEGGELRELHRQKQQARLAEKGEVEPHERVVVEQVRGVPEGAQKGAVLLRIEHACL